MDQLEIYKEQLKQIDLALESTTNPSEKTELLGLKESILELLTLTKEDKSNNEEHSTTNSVLDDEYALFMSEMGKEGAFEAANRAQNALPKFDLDTIEGKKCRAPHKHQWGSIAYHNAMVCSIDSTNEDEIKVRVLFINPTHKEMIPCPYYFENDCKFSEETCHYSHGEVVLLSSLQEYDEPDFKSMSVGSRVLAKQHNLWHSARIKSIYKDKCLVKFESNQKPSEVLFEDIFPLTKDVEDVYDTNSDSDENADSGDNEDIINLSLMITPIKQALGEWEKHTKGIGSKLMQKMGYIVGTGLGRKGEGRIDPVTAVVLPPGKSLDHCMKLREEAGGDKDLFSAERKLKRMQKREEARSKREYEKEKNKTDVFSFINNTLTPSTSDNTFTKTKHRIEIKKDTSRNLNVASLKTEESIKGIERDLYKIKESLTRHVDKTSLVHKQLKSKLYEKETELKNLQTQAMNIKNEQSMRNDKRKLTIF